MVRIELDDSMVYLCIADSPSHITIPQNFLLLVSDPAATKLQLEEQGVNCDRIAEYLNQLEE